MRLFFTALLAGLLLGATGTAFGYPSLIGPTGLTVVPTADAAPLGGLQVAATMYTTEDDALTLDNTLIARATFGVFPMLEVGAAFWRTDFAGDDLDTISANAKFVLPIGLIGGDTALGAILARTNVPIGSDITTTYLYVANSRGIFGIPGGIQTLQFTIGANWTQFENGVSVDGLRGFAGLELALMDTLSVAAEYQTESDDLGDADPLTSLVARLAISDNFILEAGVTNANPIFAGFNATDEHNLYASIIFGWGGN